MNSDRMVFAIAGMMILASLALSQLHSVHWLWLTAFVGANMFQAAFTGFCPLARILRTMGKRPGTAFNGCAVFRSAFSDRAELDANQ